MEYISTPSKGAEKVRTLMLRMNLFDRSRAVIHSRSYVYFPTLNIKDAKHIKLIGRAGGKITTRKVPEAPRKGYEQQVKEELGDNYAKLAKGYDLLGDIAIIDFDGNAEDARKVANTLMQHNKSIKTVLAKAGAVSGKFRTRKLKYVSGKRNFIALHKENNCTFKFDVRKVYFSNRLSFERSRILKLTKDGENVMVMFAGVGPFAIEIAKLRKKSNVVGIEANRFGYSAMKENIKINKTPNVTAVLGDVKKVSGKYKGFADRIIMPLPWSSLKYLDLAHAVAKKKSMVHLYAFTDSEKAAKKVFDSIKAHAKANSYKVALISSRIVRPYSKRQLEVVIDYRMAK